jgi:hypothetical protein
MEGIELDEVRLNCWVIVTGRFVVITINKKERVASLRSLIWEANKYGFDGHDSTDLILSKVCGLPVWAQINSFRFRSSSSRSR